MLLASSKYSLIIYFGITEYQNGDGAPTTSSLYEPYVLIICNDYAILQNCELCISPSEKLKGGMLTHAGCFPAALMAIYRDLIFPCFKLELADETSVFHGVICICCEINHFIVT